MRRLVAKRHVDTWFLLIMTGALLVVFRIVQPGWLNSQTIQIREPMRRSPSSRWR